MIAKARMLANASGPISIELWSSTLERYGAAQLNDRYRARFGRSMSSAAWAGWVAVKIAWEASLRARSVESNALLRVLESDATQFDGHKGTPLSFRRWDHQLRQPLYATERGANHERVVADLPDVGRNNARPMRDELDEFGFKSGETSCRLSQ
jgi:ABC transporter substrate binding protein (PQQ-dependent alcohol dehydrogenase system)